jgi:hypothetical protein
MRWLSLIPVLMLAQTTEEAAQALRSSRVFQKPRYIEVIAGGRMPLNVTRPHYRVLDTLGLIQYKVENGVAEVYLTRTGEVASRGWRLSYTGSYGDATLWHVPVATRVLLQQVRTTGAAFQGHADLEFSWRWQPNRIGDALGIQKTTFSTKAALIRENGVWRVDEPGLLRGLKDSDPL